MPPNEPCAVRSSVAKTHYGSRSRRGTQVAGLFYTLSETAKLLGVDPNTYLLRALYGTIAQPGTVNVSGNLPNVESKPPHPTPAF